MSIHEYIKKYVDEDFDITEELPVPVREGKFPKGSILTEYGEIERRAFFLRKGIVEISVSNGEKESIMDFIFPDFFFASYTSFLTGEPSDRRLECLTDCTADVMMKEDILKAYQHSLLINKLGRCVSESLYMRRSLREKEFLIADAEQRYAKLVLSRPELIDAVPLYKIANYLGIHPESLSRIRRKIAS